MWHLIWYSFHLCTLFFIGKSNILKQRNKKYKTSEVPIYNACLTQGHIISNVSKGVTHQELELNSRSFGNLALQKLHSLFFISLMTLSEFQLNALKIILFLHLHITQMIQIHNSNTIFLYFYLPIQMKIDKSYL